MSRRAITGSNNIPLGPRRRFIENVAESPQSSTTSDFAQKRGRSPTTDGPRKRRKGNRWGGVLENKAAGLMGLTLAIYARMTNEQREAYVLYLRIEEISQKLRINDVVPADGNRSISPAPMYDNIGRRTNTREARYRKRLEDERHKLVERAIKQIPNYHPPADYRRPTKTQEKVYVPVNDYPEINFIGLLIGPRGNTLKNMETESGAKIAIRGKGSVKEGKGRSDNTHASNQEEDLHCLIMADTEEKVNKAKKLINKIIETAASIPEGQNELKRNQLRELATLNGTLRDDENQACQNCGEIGHRRYDCKKARSLTSSVICRFCGNNGHFARECTDRPKGMDWNNGPASRLAGSRGGENEDREYESLMQELNGSRASVRPQGRIEAANNAPDNGPTTPSILPPWQRAATGAPAPWARLQEDNLKTLAEGGNSNVGGAWPGGFASQVDQSSKSVPPWQLPSTSTPYTIQQHGGPHLQASGGEPHGSDSYHPVYMPGYNGTHDAPQAYPGDDDSAAPPPPPNTGQFEFGDIPPPPPGDVPSPPPPPPA